MKGYSFCCGAIRCSHTCSYFKELNLEFPNLVSAAVLNIGLAFPVGYLGLCRSMLSLILERTVAEQEAMDTNRNTDFL